MPPPLSRTALHPAHLALHARLVPFAGWEMPIQYSGIIAEHRAVRTAWGMFDVSHMGRLDIRGDLAGLRDQRARFGFLCLPDGGILDDVVTLRHAAAKYLLVCNAANRPAVVAWLEQRLPAFPGVSLRDLTLATAMIAVQGPQAVAHMDALLAAPVSSLKRFAGMDAAWHNTALTVTRTGYTGEDGVEVTLPAASAVALWDALAARGCTPCALGARDTLRLEAGLMLHGNDIDRAVNPLEAAQERFVSLDKPDFTGKAALLAAQAGGLTRRLAAFKSDAPVGAVTSGSFSPTLEVNIGLGPPPARRPRHAPLDRRPRQTHPRHRLRPALLPPVYPLTRRPISPRTEAS
ncbi:MAG: glycine cleavage system aminomethyltransferase GcvT [Dehalococcoidia bacterium]|nr:glycine cleavage system aminomethyltransferase GcvT [Dehalococcoidia bacterium]